MNPGRTIVIADYDASWPRRFEEERAMILRACGAGAFTRIEHVGSTAVPGLGAKPVIDIMPGVRSLDAFMPYVERIETLGYQYAPETEGFIPGEGEGIPERRYFRKEVDGVRAFHLHVVEHGGDFWTRHLRFRNELRMRREDRHAYDALKRRLAAEYNASLAGRGVSTTAGYTDHKTKLIEGVLARAQARIDRSAPVVIAPYDAAWPALYERERALVAAAAGDAAVAIEHVGSTSVPGLDAKPVIDIALGARTLDAARARVDALCEAGWTRETYDETEPDWIYIGKRRRDTGRSEAHLHMVPFGGDRWNRYLLFRDRLRAHPGEAAAYAALKRDLAAEFGADRTGYAEAKSDFVNWIGVNARRAP